MKRIPKEDKAGLYITVIIHLTVIIILLASQIGVQIQKENSFVLDFSKQEEIEKLEKELKFKEEVSRRLDELISENGGSTPVRNVIVDRGALKDDRGTDADQLYKDAERLQNELDKTFSQSDSPDEDVYIPTKKQENKKKEKEQNYSGPSVVSYSLDGRKASKLPIPAYRCMGSGEVTVIITVDNAGNVIMAKIEEASSTSDTCLRNFAIRAAESARFSASPTAPARQVGNIVYAFIAQ